MAFGIDTFTTRLDMLIADPTKNPPQTAQLLDYFRQWNGGTVTLPDAAIVGGDPAFAGRNFLGGSFIWGHAEHTNASTESNFATNQESTQYYNPLAPTALCPDQPQNLTLTVPLIAPIQAPQPARQQQPGERGFFYGQIDAQAIRNRILACIHSGELSLPVIPPSSAASPVNVWLAVDPSVKFSADYWAGWSDLINTMPDDSLGIHPFRACILCSYTQGTGGLLRPDTNVTAALTDTSYPGRDKRCLAFWADALVGTTSGALTPNPTLDWNSFDPKAKPVLWRLKNGFTLATEQNSPPAISGFNADAIDPNAVQAPTNFMLTTNKWQPHVPSIANLGFSQGGSVTAHIPCLQTTQMPGLGDAGYGANTDNGAINGHHFIPAGPIKVIGRYIRVKGATDVPTFAEAQALSSANFSIFTVWESSRGTRNPRLIGYYNPNPRDGLGDSGTLDGTDAFNYCAYTLMQPPQTPVYFAIDFDPFDPDQTDPATAADKAAIESWIVAYFRNIGTVRDNFAIQTGLYYLIGVYGNGRIMDTLYKNGVVSHFWAPLSRRSGSKPPRWPWYHVNRWQYTNEEGLYLGGNLCAMVSRTQKKDNQGNPILDQNGNPTFNYGGPDPDADWGDGGTWSLTDPITQQFNTFRGTAAAAAISEILHKLWNGLTEPAPLPPVTTP